MKFDVERIEKIEPFKPFVLKIQFDTDEEVKELRDELIGQQKSVPNLILIAICLKDELKRQGYVT